MQTPPNVVCPPRMLEFSKTSDSGLTGGGVPGVTATQVRALRDA